MLRTILTAFLLFGAVLATAQSHLHFNYVIEAGVFQDDSITYFVAHEYPVFSAHPDAQAERLMQERFQQDNPLTVFQDTHRFKSRTTLPQISDDALLDPDGLLELLRNRMGMTKAEFAQLPHQVSMTLHSIRYPNHQQPYFNHQTWQAERNTGMKRFKHEKQEAAVDWSTGEALTLGTVGGASSLGCLQKAIADLDLPMDDCKGKDLTKALEESNYCDWTIRRIEADYLELNAAETGFKCLEEEENGTLKISMDCFQAGEGTCGE